MLSRVLGLIREQVFAYMFGAGFITDAFQIAFRIPNLLRDLFAEGSMSSALVPIYTKVRKDQGEAAAWDLVSRIICVLGVTISALSILGIAWAAEIVSFFPLEGNPQKFELTVRLTQVMIPFLPSVFLAAVWMSVLNARERFSRPALAPSLFNVLSIFAAFTLCPLAVNYGVEPIYGMAVGVVLGGLAQWFFQVPALRREGFRFRWRFQLRDPQLLKVIGLMGFGAIGLAATQVNVLVNSFLALSQGDGAVSWLNYAFRLMQFPIGVFGVAIAQVTLTKVAQSSAEQDFVAIRDSVLRSIRMAVAITLPSAVGLAFFGYPIISLIYERGQFGAADSEATAHALAAYAIGLSAYSCNKVLVPVLYSLQKPLLAVLSSAGAVCVNIILCLLLVKPLGFAGLALGTSLAAYFNLMVLLYAVSRFSGGLAWRGLADGVLRSAAAALCLGIVLFFFWQELSPFWADFAFPARVGLVLAGLFFGGGTYWIGAKIFGLAELRDLESLVARIGRKLGLSRREPSE